MIEIKPNIINKGIAAKKQITGKNFDFIIAMGDDITDEDLFKLLPKDTYSFKVGTKDTNAKYRIKDVSEVRKLMRMILE